jgi:tetratricopeptide (TPR) repeat protein
LKRRAVLRAAAFVLLLVLPLAYTPLTVDLLPQKALVAAIALPLAAWAAPSIARGALLAAGLVVLALRPDVPWEVLLVAGAPAAWGALRAIVEADLPFVLRLVRRAVIAESAVALAGAAGLLPFDTGAFHLPYAVLVGTLGNPNHLAAFLLLALPLVAVPLPDARPADRIEVAAAASLAVLTLLLTRSHLAALGLVATAALLLPRLWLALPLAALALVAMASAPEGLSRAFEGRVYLLAVHARALLEPGTLALGIGPGAHPSRFLGWQADHLAAHPEDAGFWTFPEHPHTDLVQLPLTWGLPAVALAALVLRRRLAWDPKLPPRPLRAAWAQAALVALGAGIAISPAAWAVLLLLLALSTRPRAPSPSPRPLDRLALVPALAWVAVAAADAFAAFHHREATRSAAVLHDLRAAEAHIETATGFPSDRGRRLHLRGRILLEEGRAIEAATSLREAARFLPHPIVWKALAAAEASAGRPEAAREAARAWLHHRPNDREAAVYFPR